MKRFAMITLLCLTAAAAWAPAEGPKLINEKLVLPDEPRWKIKENKGFQSMRLSPSGKYLLYISGAKPPAATADGDRLARKGRFSVICRDLKTGKEKPLPIPKYMDDDIPVIMLTMQMFDKAEKKIIIGAGVDANNDGIFDDDGEKMTPAIFTIATGKIDNLPIQDSVVVPTFDRTGKRAIVFSMNKEMRNGKLSVTPLDKIKLTTMSVLGLPWGLCPTADIMPLMPVPIPGPDGKRGPQGLVLYDLKTDKQVAKLTLDNKRSSPEDDPAPRWTPDGRYLYYSDVKAETSPQGESTRKRFTRVWDRTKKKEVGILDELMPVGPGPTATTVLLVKKDRRGLILHDAVSGKTWPFGDAMTVITARGRYVVYAKEAQGDAKAGLYIATIALPKGMKAKLTPKKAPPPKKIAVPVKAIKRP